MSELRNEDLLARIRILESLGGFWRVDSSVTRLPIVEVFSGVPSNVMLRSLEHVPTSRQKDDDALNQCVQLQTMLECWVHIRQSCLALTSINCRDFAHAFINSFSDWLAIDSTRNARSERRTRPTTSLASPLPSGNRRGIPAFISSIDSKIPFA